MMYKIDYTEVLQHTFYVDADTLQEAKNKFDRQLDSGEVDFSDGELTDSKIEIAPNS